MPPDRFHNHARASRASCRMIQCPRYSPRAEHGAISPLTYRPFHGLFRLHRLSTTTLGLHTWSTWSTRSPSAALWLFFPKRSTPSVVSNRFLPLSYPSCELWPRHARPPTPPTLCHGARGDSRRRICRHPREYPSSLVARSGLIVTRLRGEPLAFPFFLSSEVHGP